jgi:hypothetical protein
MAIFEFVPTNTLSARLCILQHLSELALCNRSLHGAQVLNVEGPLFHELKSGFALAANVYFPPIQLKSQLAPQHTHFKAS